GHMPNVEDGSMYPAPTCAAYARNGIRIKSDADRRRGFFPSVLSAIQRLRPARLPTPKITTNGFIPNRLRPRATQPITARNFVFTAERQRLHSACKINAIMTGLIPYSRPTTCGNDPYLT